MSTALPFSGVGELSPSRTETEAFGFEVARLTIGGAWHHDAADADELAVHVAEVIRQAPHDTVIVRFPSDLVEIARLEWPSARRPQHAGTLLYWEDPLVTLPDTDVTLREGLQADVHHGERTMPDDFVSSALGVVADSFHGYVNHYAYNTRIPAAVARDGYVDWARRTLVDPAGAALVVREGADAIAVATLRWHDHGSSTVGEVELASVSSARQGAGIYRDLWAVVRETARGAGADQLIISTQSSNIRVQRAWARLGLVPLASFDTLHLSLNPLD